MKYRYAAYPPSETYDLYTGLWPAGSEGQKKWEAAAYPALYKRFDASGYTLAKRGWNMLFRLRHREGGEVCLGNHSLYGYYRRFWAAEKGQEQLFGARHSDWFAQGYEGQPPQMCYTNRGLVEQVAKDADEFFETGKSRSRSMETSIASPASSPAPSASNSLSFGRTTIAECSTAAPGRMWRRMSPTG